MSQSYRKYEITTTFKQEICRNLTFPLRLRQILIINAQIKDFKIRNKALVSNKNWTLMIYNIKITNKALLLNLLSDKQIIQCKRRSKQVGILIAN